MAKEHAIHAGLVVPRLPSGPPQGPIHIEQGRAVGKTSGHRPGDLNICSCKGASYGEDLERCVFGEDVFVALCEESVSMCVRVGARYRI